MDLVISLLPSNASVRVNYNNKREAIDSAENYDATQIN
jgi:hypothetical protein